MAQSDNYFGLRRGSTKSQTYTIRHGKQITKDRVTAVTNPQTSEQMAQRIKVPIVAQASSVLHDLVNHSFEGVSYGETSINMFRSLNLKKGELTISSYVPKGAQDSGEADYIVSKGSLDINPVATHQTRLFSLDMVNDKELIAIDNEFPLTAEAFSKLPLGTVFPNSIIDYFTQRAMVFKLGDQITFLIGKDGQEYSWTVNNTTKTAKRHTFVVGRLVFAHDNAITNRWTYVQQATLDSDGNYIKYPIFSDGYIDIFFDVDDPYTTEIQFQLASDREAEHVKDRTACMATAIRSQRTTNNLWLRSTSRLVVDISQGITAADVLPTYLNSSSASAKYLNSGVDGVGITGGTT